MRHTKFGMIWYVQDQLPAHFQGLNQNVLQKVHRSSEAALHNDTAKIHTFIATGCISSILNLHERG